MGGRRHGKLFFSDLGMTPTITPPKAHQAWQSQSVSINQDLCSSLHCVITCIGIQCHTTQDRFSQSPECYGSLITRIWTVCTYLYQAPLDDLVVNLEHSSKQCHHVGVVV